MAVERLPGGNFALARCGVARGGGGGGRDSVCLDPDAVPRLLFFLVTLLLQVLLLLGAAEVGHVARQRRGAWRWVLVVEKEMWGQRGSGKKTE